MKNSVTIHFVTRRTLPRSLSYPSQRSNTAPFTRKSGVSATANRTTAAACVLSATYQWQHEPILYGFLQNGKHPWYSDRKQTTIWNYDKPKRNKDHPTSKPLDLLGYPIQNSSQENSVVIDTFGGSGSTLMACEQLNRICYMMELDPKYASVILRRYVEDTDDADNVYVVRNGEQISYADLVKQVDFETV